MSASDPGSEGALLGVHAEHARRGRGSTSRPSASDTQLAVDHALVDEIHPVLDAAHAVRDLGEVAEPQLLLVLHAERAMVGGHDRQLVHAQTFPKVGMVMTFVVLRPDRGRAHELGALEPWPGEMILERHIEVLRAGLGKDVRTLVSCRGHGIKRFRRRHVHDVQRHVARGLGQDDGSVRRLALQDRRTGQPVIHRIGLATGERLPTSTSIAMPFSACIMIIAPFSDAVCRARRI